MSDLYIFGAGGFASEVNWMIRDTLLPTPVAFIDLVSRPNFMGKPVFTQDVFKKGDMAVIAFGDPFLREKIAKSLIDFVKPQNDKELNNLFPKVIHPSAYIGDGSSVGYGSVICHNSLITTNIKLGNFTQLNLTTTIGHDTICGDYFTTAPQVAIAGNNRIGERVYFGINSSTIQKVNIVSGATIGAGACVVKSINAAGIYVGVPAKLK